MSITNNRVEQQQQQQGIGTAIDVGDVAEQEIQAQTPVTDLNIDEVMDAYNQDQIRNLDEKEMLKLISREDIVDVNCLSHVENPEGLYPTLNMFLTERVRNGVENYANARAMSKVHSFIESRMKKIVCICVRHYDNTDLLTKQQGAMTPQELELCGKVLRAIKEFRTIIYKN